MKRTNTAITTLPNLSRLCIEFDPDLISTPEACRHLSDAARLHKNTRRLLGCGILTTSDGKTSIEGAEPQQSILVGTIFLVR